MKTIDRTELVPFLNAYPVRGWCYVPVSVRRDLPVDVGAKVDIKSKFRNVIIQNAYENCGKLMNSSIEVGFGISNEIEYLDNLYLAVRRIHQISLNRNLS